MYMNLNERLYWLEESGQGPPILLLHGFTGSSLTWREVLPFLETDFRVIRLDLPGHGKTVIQNSIGMNEFCKDLAKILNYLGIDQVHLAGYSLGGRTALSFANYFPEKVSSLILESASPGLEESMEREKRKNSDEKLAKKIIDSGTEQFVSEWESLSLFATQKKLPKSKRLEIRKERLSHQAEGLANSLIGMGTGAQSSWWDKLSSLQVPVLLLAGSADEKFIDINQRMNALIDRSYFHIISGAGHAVHVEQAEFFGTIVHGFLLKIINNEVEGFQLTVNWSNERNYEDILYETYNGIAKITINRPEVRNAFRPKTVNELIDAFSYARDDSNIGVIVLAGAGDDAFCSGGDQKVRGHGGYVGEDEIPRLNVLDLQRLIRVIPKPVIAMVSGYAIGGGHVLHVVCDLTIAADNAIFGQTGPKVGSFDAGYGAGLLARMVGQKKAREIWFLCRQYSAQEAMDMGLVNTVVPLDQLEAETVQWCEEILEKSPTALRFLKASLNADTDGLAGLQQMGGDATLLYYTTDEAKEGRDAFKEKRKPDFKQFPRFP